MIRLIMSAIEHDSAVVPIAKTWLLAFISLWVSMIDIDVFFRVLVAVSVIIYTTLKSISVHLDNKEKRNKKNHDKDNKQQPLY